MLQKAFAVELAFLFRGSQRAAAAISAVWGIAIGLDTISGGKSVARFGRVLCTVLAIPGLAACAHGWLPQPVSLFLLGGFNGNGVAPIWALLLGYQTMMVLCLALAILVFGATDRTFCGSQGQETKIGAKIRPDGSSKNFVYASRLLSHA